jgi:uncharacterized surface protein with fasciclin (FAS1) repeats
MLKNILAVIALSSLCMAPAFAQSMSSGMPAATPNIVQDAVATPTLSTLVSLVKQAGLVETLSGPGPFTVFAPTNAAFEKLPKATLDAVNADKALLARVLTYHVVAGKVDAATLVGLIKVGNGTAVVKTVQGGSLTASIVDGKVMLKDAHGNMATVVKSDVAASNGVVHVIDTVVQP